MKKLRSPGSAILHVEMLSLVMSDVANLKDGKCLIKDNFWNSTEKIRHLLQTHFEYTVVLVVSRGPVMTAIITIVMLIQFQPENSFLNL